MLKIIKTALMPIKIKSMPKKVIILLPLCFTNAKLRRLLCYTVKKDRSDAQKAIFTSNVKFKSIFEQILDREEN